MKIEYRVRPVTRYIVTRFELIEPEGGNNSGAVSERGEYGNNEIAFEVAYALCRAEHENLGWPIADERISYPVRCDGHQPVPLPA